MRECQPVGSVSEVERYSGQTKQFNSISYKRLFSLHFQGAMRQPEHCLQLPRSRVLRLKNQLTLSVTNPRAFVVKDIFNSRNQYSIQSTVVESCSSVVTMRRGIRRSPQSLKKA